MGLTVSSVGKKANETQSDLSACDVKVLLAGCPNVGKSTVFNALTGLKQHTGNWPGKTVTNSVGYFNLGAKKAALVDLPGTYSLSPHSEEERVARESICFSQADATVVVCDATTLEKCLLLTLQILEITKNVIVCLNLMDEAEKKNIRIDLAKLEKLLGVPVVATNAREKDGLNKLTDEIGRIAEKPIEYEAAVIYDDTIEKAADELRSADFELDRFMKIRLLCNDTDYIENAEKFSGKKVADDKLLSDTLNNAKGILYKDGYSVDNLRDSITSAVLKKAAYIDKAVTKNEIRNDLLDRKLDKIFTGKYTAVPVMLLLMTVVFFITIYAANYPSALLSNALFSFGELIRSALLKMHTASWLVEPLIDGVWRVMAWVVSVMLPPMAIFFPLFTLLEDFGYLPRMAFNLDGCFKKCNACGKQSLCMAMGFGCNAAGVVGCRIIDSPRERLIAILTNSIVPCNGRFPTIIAVISMFFVCTLSGTAKSVSIAAMLSLVIIFSVAVTLVLSYVLSKTILKGQPSSFTLELPPFRIPKIGDVIVRSIFDRTLFVLGRALTISAPMGLIIWILANVNIGGTAIILHISDFLEPIGKFMGLDGIVLLAFILGFPANEIVLPIMLMCYLSQGTLTEITDYGSIFSILSSHGWTAVTGICFIIFSLLHFPCSTTLMTIKKETGSLKYTALAALLPTALGIGICAAVSAIV